MPENVSIPILSSLLTLHLLCMEYVKVFLLCIYHFSAIVKPRYGERTGTECIVSGYHLSSGHQDTCFTCSSPASVLHGNTKPTLSRRRTLAYQNINKEEQNSQQLQSLPSHVSQTLGWQVTGSHVTSGINKKARALAPDTPGIKFWSPTFWAPHP